MSPCLVQQLFRQKIGKELDRDLVDDILFPMLRLRKHPSKELLLDIKLTQSSGSNEHGQSAIVICRVVDPNDDVPEEDIPKNIPPFEGGCRGERWRRLPGKVPSQMRRLRHESVWGSIDILNELRSLKHPQIRHHRPINPEDQFDYPSEFEDVYVSLQEQPLPWSFTCGGLSPPKTESREQAEKIAADRDFVNDYLEDALNNGKRISWGGSPYFVNNFDAILSTYY